MAATSHTERWRQALRRVTEDGGLGFCHAALPDLLPADYHGPLVIALDSSVLIDLQDYGGAIFNGELTRADIADQQYYDELQALGAMLQVWMLRDVRFVLTPHAREDGRRRQSELAHERRSVSISVLAESLCYQTGEWNVDLSLEGPLEVNPTPAATGLAASDRQLVAEAMAVGAHAFLTRDSRLIDRLDGTATETLVTNPTTVTGALIAAGVGTFTWGGLCELWECPYRSVDLPFPDTGKWAGLLTLFGH